MQLDPRHTQRLRAFLVYDYIIWCTRKSEILMKASTKFELGGETPYSQRNFPIRHSISFFYPIIVAMKRTARLRCTLTRMTLFDLASATAALKSVHSFSTLAKV